MENQILQDHILIRYGELSLKKTNRKQFILQLIRSIKRACKDFEELTYESRGLRFYIHLNGTNPESLIPILEKIPGIYSFSVVTKCSCELEEIYKYAEILVREELKEGAKTFKVETNRSDKTFPMNSLEISQNISRYLFRNIEGLKADVHHPDFTLDVDLRVEGCFLFTKIYKGLGGMPAGCMGKVMLMISGGLDSVVAGYQAIRKGMQVEAIHFASPPYTSDLAVQKVVDLLEKLTPYTEYQDINLYIVPFTNIQKAIYEHCREDYGITIMRRMMYRIAEKEAGILEAQAIVNGENVGQVASQTLESINTIESVVTIPVIRPLATYDKEEIVGVAKKIGTFDISIRPYEDCCTVFVPKHPQIKPRLNNALIEEQKFDFAPLVDEAVANIKRVVLHTNKHYSVIEKEEDLI